MSRILAVLVFIAAVGCDSSSTTGVVADDPGLRKFANREITADELRKLESEREKVTSLQINYCPIDAKVLATVAKLTSLQSLNLAYTDLTDDDLSRLKHLTRLETVWFPFTKISDQGLPVICQLPAVSTIGLDSTRITDAGLRFLGSQKQIRRLHVGGNDISDAGVAALANLTSLRELRINHNEQLTNASIASISSLAELQVLQIDNTSIDDRCIEDLLKLKNLRFIHTGNLGFSKSAMERIRSELPKFGKFD